MRGILKRMATFFVALTSIFLLVDVFSNLQKELVWIGITIIIAIPVVGYVLASLVSKVLSIRSISVQKRNLEEFLRAHWRALTGMGIYQAIMWLIDNPIWIAVQLKWHEEGVGAMMFYAILSNAAMLVYHRRKEGSWLGLEDVIGFLQSKEEDLVEMFFLLTSPGVLIALFLSALLSSNPIKCLQALFIFFIIFESVILFVRMMKIKLDDEKISAIFFLLTSPGVMIALYASTLLSSDPTICLQALFIFFIIFESVILFVRMMKTRLSDVVAFFLLSFWQDSFIATMYLRHGRCANGLGIRDWTIFFLSSLVSITYWALRNGLIAEFVLRPILKV